MFYFDISDSCKAENNASIKQAVSARDCLIYLRDAKLFTTSDVIFVQYLFKRIDCKELFVECYKYAEKQEALCFYEKPPSNIFLSYQYFVLKSYYYLILCLFVLLAYKYQNT